jgi:hypothetical protein
MQQNPKLREFQFQTRMNADLLRVHDHFLKTIEEWKGSLEEAKSFAREIQAQAERIKSLPKGEKGDSVQGPPGKDVDIEEVVARVLRALPELKDGKDADEEVIVSRVLGSIRTPKDGESPTIDHDQIADTVLEKLTKGKKLKIEHVDGLRNEVDSYRHQMAMKQAGQHGGGDTVAAGTNISITRNANGTTTISSTGGSSTPLLATGVVNGVNAVFGVTARPTSVVSDGTTYFEGSGYSYAALSITFDVPPSLYQPRYYV